MNEDNGFMKRTISFLKKNKKERGGLGGKLSKF